ncbi:hypothetical protein ACJJTC_004156, partial [Scirpophaga incertulas]
MAYSLYLYSAAGGVTARAMKLASVVPRTTEVRRRRRLQKINMLVCDIVRMRKLCTVVVLHPCDDYGVLVLDTARWTMKRSLTICCFHERVVGGGVLKVRGYGASVAGARQQRVERQAAQHGRAQLRAQLRHAARGGREDLTLAL